MSKRESAPLYPKYYSPCPERILAYYMKKEGIVTEEETRLDIGETLSTFKETMWIHNLLLFVDNILTFPHLRECIEDKKCEVMCDSKGVPIGIHLKGHQNTTRWVVSIHRWGLSCCLEALGLLRSLVQHCRVGCATTPGSLGQAIMRQTYREHNLQRHTRPHAGAVDMLHQHGFGGRADTVEPGTFPRLMELDRKNAYVAEFNRHPSGTATRIASSVFREHQDSHGIPGSIVTWFGECRVTLSSDCRFGCFPTHRCGDTPIVYPTAKGTYDTHLWKEQADDIHRIGGRVTVLNGWGWSEWTEDNMHWCAVVEHLRRTAPTQEIADLVKLAIVAGIGRHAMSNVMHQLVPEERYSPGDEPVAEEGLFGAYYVHQFSDPKHCNMIHWNSYTVMQMSRALYHFALPYAELGWLVATNFDAIYLKLWRYEELSFPEKGSQQDKDSPSGTWRRRILYQNQDNDRPMVGVRSINAVDRNGAVIDTQPGVSR